MYSNSLHTSVYKINFRVRTNEGTMFQIVSWVFLQSQSFWVLGWWDSDNWKCLINSLLPTWTQRNTYVKICGCQFQYSIQFGDLSLNDITTTLLHVSYYVLLFLPKITNRRIDKLVYQQIVFEQTSLLYVSCTSKLSCKN